MRPRGTRPTRRCMIGLGASVFAPWSLPDPAAAAGPGPAEIDAALRALEREHDARVGVFAHNTATGATVAHRADERFPLCSVYRPLAVAAVLRDLDRDGSCLPRTVHRAAAGAGAARTSPVPGQPGRLVQGTTVEDLCRAAVRSGDRTAGNQLLHLLGGPTAVTRFCRSLGDPVTRLDRWEPELNSAEPWRSSDTTSPRGIARTYHRLTLGDALGGPDRRRLAGWLRDAAPPLPGDDWTTDAAQTGTGGFGTGNTVRVAWTPRGAPVVLAVLTTRPRHPDAGADDALPAATTALLTGLLG